MAVNTLTKLALGLMGQNKPRPAVGGAETTRTLRPPRQHGGMPLMDALSRRQSQRSFASRPLDDQCLSDLLWAAAGINRPELGGRTAPSAMNAQEVQVYVALAKGLFLYEPRAHELQWVLGSDVRSVTGYQDFVDEAALDLIYVADHTRMSLVPAVHRSAFAFAAAGAMAQNVYLYCASAGLATVIRAWFDHRALSQAMGLPPDHQLLLSQTVGRLPAHAPA
jgi:nitroreductase